MRLKSGEQGRVTHTHKCQETIKTDIKKASHKCCDFCFLRVNLLFVAELTENQWSLQNSPSRCSMTHQISNPILKWKNIYIRYG